MINRFDMDDFGILSAKKADYIAHNRMEINDKTDMAMSLLFQNAIAYACLHNETTANIPLEKVSVTATEVVLRCKHLFEELGYEVAVTAIQIACDSEHITFNIKISWGPVG